MTATIGWATRLRRGAAFVAIVWGVAASYVLFEVAALRAMNWALAYPDAFGALAVSPTVSESTTCLAAPGDHAPAPSAARARAYELGVAVGREAVFRQWAVSNPAAIAPFTAEVERAAAALDVPAPGAFVPQSRANANSEFIAWIEADDRRTARRVAARYSAQACYAYKLGAVWGYSEVVRMALPDHRAAFGVEIRHYAQQIPIPEGLWRPMLQPSTLPAGSAALESHMAALGANLAAFLSDGNQSR